MDGLLRIISTEHGTRDAKMIAQENGWDWEFCVYAPWGQTRDIRERNLCGITGLRNYQLYGPFTMEERLRLTLNGNKGG